MKVDLESMKSNASYRLEQLRELQKRFEELNQNVENADFYDDIDGRKELLIDSMELLEQLEMTLCIISSLEETKE